MTTIQNKKSKYKSSEEEHPISEDEDFLKSKTFVVQEEMITGADALGFHKYLTNTLNDPKVDRMVKEALKMFPDPDKPTKIRIKI